MAHNIQAMMTHQAGDSKGDEGEGDEDGGFAQLCGDGARQWRARRQTQTGTPTGAACIQMRQKVPVSQRTPCQ